MVGKAQELYQLRCKNGVLWSCLSASELEAFVVTFESEEWADESNH